MTDDARADWEKRIGRRGVPGQDEHEGVAGALARPTGLRAVSGQGHVTLDWDRVPGAAGYLVYRAAGEPYEPLDHGGGDVLAFPAGPYADTSGEPGRVRHYAVAAVADGASTGPLSDSIAAAPSPGTNGRPTLTIEVGAAADPGRLARPWQPMVGSEHLSCWQNARRRAALPHGGEPPLGLPRVVRLAGEQAREARLGRGAPGGTRAGGALPRWPPPNLARSGPMSPSSSPSRLRSDSPGVGAMAFSVAMPGRE